MFAVGIAVRSVVSLGSWFLVLILILIVAVGLLYLQCTYKKVCVLALVTLVFFGLGVVRMNIAVPYMELPEVNDSEVVLQGTIVREPDIRDTYVNLVLEVPEYSELFLVRADVRVQFKYADEIKVTGVLEPVENFAGEGGRVFNYRGYLAKDAIYRIMAFPEVEIVRSSSTPIGALLQLKRTYLDSLKRMLQEPFAALAGGITVGERRSLGEKLTEDFRATGLIHIIVLSGYNIAIIVIAISALLMFLPPKPRYISAIVVIILFTLLVGASATVVRAAIMGSIGAIGAMTGRSYSALHALMFAVLAMLLWNPYLLVFDPSFQLSVMATLGLLFGVPLLVPYLTRIPNKFKLRELTAATISTQIAVYPLLMYMMGEVSLVALPVNLLVLPIIPIAMLFVFLTGVLGTIHFILALPFAYIAQGTLLYVFKVVEIFAALPFAKVGIPTFSFWVAGGVYIIFGIGVWLLQKNNKEKATHYAEHRGR